VLDRAMVLGETPGRMRAHGMVAMLAMPAALVR
jgi:hypothetical protein